MVVDVAEVIALIQLEARKLGDLVYGSGEEVALRGDDLPHRHELALEREQLLQLLVGRAGENSRFESIDVVIRVRQDREEAVDKRIEDVVQQKRLAVQRTTIELFALAVEGRK